MSNKFTVSDYFAKSHSTTYNSRVKGHVDREVMNVRTLYWKRCIATIY